MAGNKTRIPKCQGVTKRKTTFLSKISFFGGLRDGPQQWKLRDLTTQSCQEIH